MHFGPELTVRALQPQDWTPVVELEAELTGTVKSQYWKRVLDRFLRDTEGLALAATTGGRLEGYLFGELRALEFGAGRCGWVFALGVRPGMTHRGIASALMAEARARFQAMGVRRVRTMVERADVPLLSLFRSQGFVGGPFVQLELELAEPSDAAHASPRTAPTRTREE